ncbi:MAG: phosphate acyltransferase PlsX [Anaerolineales bacterium]|nr:phosphate acyltransferase PlsX [Anaerolineales bacterium]
MRIVLDAMGSDNHPGPEVEAAIELAGSMGENLILVGDAARLKDMLGSRAPKVEVVNAPDVFEMSDHIGPGALRRSQNSMGIGLDLVKSGEAGAFVTAGNTAGALAIALARLGRLQGVLRPALTVMYPVRGGKCVALDIGANAECKPEYLLQFGLMGAVYAEQILGVGTPRVGLISNGEEEGKGSDLVKAAYPLLAASGLNFVGNMESKELFGGHADVAVTDGFTGNVLMKTAEAVAKLITDRLREELMASPLTKLGGLLSRPAFRSLRKDLDPAEVGAATLLGVNGLVFIGHGRSDARAIISAVKLAQRSVDVGLLASLRTRIEQGLSQIKSPATG